jgi:hypothetical protein
MMVITTTLTPHPSIPEAVLFTATIGTQTRTFTIPPGPQADAILAALP